MWQDGVQPEEQFLEKEMANWDGSPVPQKLVGESNTLVLVWVCLVIH